MKMKKLIMFSVFTLYIGLVSANEVEDKKLVLINELIEVTNALDFAISMGDMVAASIVQQSGLSPEVSEIISKETKKIIHEELIENGFVTDLMHNLYKKHFTLAEIKDLLTFYRSDTGKKATSVLPVLSQEAMVLTKEHMAIINPKLQKSLRKVLENQ
jgi:hypothetical protein